MKRPLLTYTTIATIAALTSQANATPTVYPTNLSSLAQINNPTTSDIVGDDTNDSIVYVMPPNKSYGTAKGLHTATENLLFCERLPMLVKKGNELVAQYAETSKEGERIYAATQAIDDKIAKAKFDLSDVLRGPDKELLERLENNIESDTTRLDQLYNTMKRCKGAACDDIEDEVKTVESDLKNAKKQMKEFFTSHLAEAKIYKKAKSKVDALVERRDEIATDFVKYQNQLMAMTTLLDSLYKSYSSMEGARASFTYDSRWSENVKLLKQLNPSYSFQHIPTQDAVIFPGVISVPGLESAKAILAFEAPGMTVSTDGLIKAAAYPETIQGNAILSLAGACPMIYPAQFKGTDQSVFDPKNMKYGLMVSFKYPAAMKLTMTARFNMQSIYRRVKEQRSSGGFFSSNSWSSDAVNHIYQDAFKVDWHSQDPGNAISNDERSVMERKARQDIYERMFLLATLDSSSTAILQTIKPSEHGALVIADGLQKVCPMNQYCIAGSMIVRALDAIIGSTSTESLSSKFENKYLTETWSNSKVILKPWLTTYQMN